MLVSFTYGGYYWLSIVFSAICMLGSYVFFFFFLFDYRKIKSVASLCYLGGLFLAVLSSAGVFYLSYTTSTEQISNEIYQSSIYYYLHYQYNGFFILVALDCFWLKLKNRREAGSKFHSICFLVDVDQYDFHLWIVCHLVGFIDQCFDFLIDSNFNIAFIEFYVN